MASNTRTPDVVRVSQKGQATIPKALREKFGIDAPGEVFVYEDDGRIVLEPVPTGDELHGIHAGDHEPGAVLARARELDDTAREREAARAERLRPGDDERNGKSDSDGGSERDSNSGNDRQE